MDMTDILQEIGTLVSTLVPAKWKRVDIAAEVSEGSTRYVANYEPADGGTRKSFPLTLGVVRLFAVMPGGPRSSVQKRWQTARFRLQDDGNVTINFDYDDGSA